MRSDAVYVSACSAAMIVTVRYDSLYIRRSCSELNSSSRENVAAEVAVINHLRHTLGTFFALRYSIDTAV